jgi:UDP-N-acetylmuramate dehydrogenase
VPEILADEPLAPRTTLRLGGPARRLVEAGTEADLVAAVRGADAAGDPVLVLAGGSNVVIADAGYDGTVVHVATAGVVREQAIGGRVRLTVAAGAPWDEVVAGAVAEGLAGIECLSGIPGSAGATPIQNVGAYGQEVASTIAAVRVFDRHTGAIEELPPSACGFAYRASAFKGRGRHVVLAVTFELEPSEESAPVRYAELAGALGVAEGESASLTAVREAVLELRRGKGMVLDPADHDTWSAGSFFTNPVMDAAAFAALRGRAAALPGDRREPPRFPESDDRVKTSAAWLIERAGFARGDARGAVALSSKHVLALTNRGGAATSELLAFAREIACRVDDLLGVTLAPEPVLVGVPWRPDA